MIDIIDGILTRVEGGGGGSPSFELPTSEQLTAGQLVTVWDNLGVAKVKKASTTLGNAVGYVSENVATSAVATVNILGVIEGLSGLTIGTPVYLSDVAGGVTQTQPVNKRQVVGVAISATQVAFNPSEAIIIV